jgi:peptidoglycan/LPS O-acetylase OafA/YrhL
MINSLTSFRFITAFVVFLFHCNIHLNWRIGVKLIDKFFEHGATFMTGFFVLSGFIMTHVYQNTDFTKRKNIFNYYIKRFAKIYPVYAIGTIAYFIVFHNYSLSQYVRIVINDLFLVQAFFPSMFGVGMNGGTWSLTVEMFLYFLFPFLMILFARNAKSNLFIGGGIALLVTINAKTNYNDCIYSSPIFRLGDFLIGVGFYLLIDKTEFFRKKIAIIHILSFLTLFFVVILFGKARYQYMFGQFLIAPLFGLWIFCVYHSKNFIYNNKITTYLGQISYSFYIWQFIAIELGRYLIRLESIHIQLIVLICLLLNIAVSAISFHFIEEPFRKLIIKKFIK